MGEFFGGLARGERGERGQAIVEVALILPLLVILIVGIIEFSLLLNARNTVSFASRDGSMLAAEGGKPWGHIDLILGRRAPTYVWPLVLDWLASH